MATRWAICGAGAISNDFTVGLKCLPQAEHQVTCITARSLERAQEFAKRFDIPKAYGSYKEMIDDSDIDVVYVGVIHTVHHDMCKQLLNAGKNVLCEKPMTMCKKQTQELIDLAKKKNVFLMEALWSRFTPSYQFIREQIKSGAIGEPKYVQAEFCTDLSVYNLERVGKKELGAGSLVDLGPYTTNIAMWAFGDDYPDEIKAMGHLTEEGYDDTCNVTLKFSNGRLAVLTTSISVNTNSKAFIYGTKGKIEVKYPFWSPTEVVVNDDTRTFPTPETNLKMKFVNSANLSFEAKAVRECLQKGEKECAGASHDYSLKYISIIDEARRQLGVVYDCDKS